MFRRFGWKRRALRRFDLGAAGLPLSRHMSNRDFEGACLTVRLGAVAANYREIRRLAGTGMVEWTQPHDAQTLGSHAAQQQISCRLGLRVDVRRGERGGFVERMAGAERLALVGMSCQASAPAIMAARKSRANLGSSHRSRLSH